MADPVTEAVVAAVLALRREQPEASALALLDVAMASCCNSNPSFLAVGLPFENWLTPPSPFARLLRDAFAPAITDAELDSAAAQDDGYDLVMESWDYMVLEPFAHRYGLWGGSVFGRPVEQEALPF